MAMTPGDIENRSFRTVRKGYSPDEVRAFLREVASAVAAQPRPELVQVGAEVANVLESAHRTAAEIEANARARAAEIIAEAEETITVQRSDIQRIKTQAEVELTNARADAKRIRTEAEAYATQLRTAADQARIDAESFAEAEQTRIKQLWSNLNSETTTRKGEADDHARRVRDEADEAARVLKAEAEERAAQVLAEAEEQVRRLRDRAEEQSSEQLTAAEERARTLVADAEERSSTMLADAEARASALVAEAEERSARLTEDAETRSATMLAEAEATATRLVDTAKIKAEEEELTAQERAQAHSLEILNQSQQRLDLILATERRTHERLVEALAEVQAAVDLVGGVPDRPVVSPPDDDTSGSPGRGQSVPRAGHEFGQFAPMAETESPVDPADRESLSRMVGDAVGQALRPFQTGTGS
jgi:DivIVA domain-containing protein